MKEDRFIKYLTLYYKKHKTINNISRDTVVDFEETPLKIGEFLASIRKQHKLYLQGDTSRGSMSKTALNRYKVLDSFSFDWEPGAKKQNELEDNDICLIYIERYYEKHKTLEGIPDSFTIDNQEYSIRNFFAHIRENHKKYLSNKNSKGSASPTALRRYQTLDNIGFDWNPTETKENKYETDDKYMKFISEYYENHSTLDNLPKTVVYDGVKLNIEQFLSDRRKNHKENETNKDYTPSKLELTRWSLLDNMNFDWTPRETKHTERMETDKYIKYLKHHYDTHKTINDIKAKQEVIFEGEILKIGDFLNDMRKKHYAYRKEIETNASIDTELMLKRYKELDEMGFDWRPSESTISISKIAKENGIKATKLRKYLKKFDGDLEKAIKISKASAKHKKTIKKAQGQSPNLSTIAQEFEIDMPTLTSLLNKQPLHTQQPKKVLMYDENTNLRQYCIDNGLNYTVIQKAIKLRMKGLCAEDLQSLINRCIIEYKSNGQQRPSTWIYSKYGNEVLVTHLLTYLKLDAEAILTDMSKNCIDLDEAIENNSFKRIAKQEYDYLEFIYKDVIKIYRAACTTKESKETATDVTLDHLNSLSQKYHLTVDEVAIVESSFDRYQNATEQYKLFNVGFEKDPNKRVEKIIEYNLDEDEIEEAFFMPLKFDKQALIGRDSELYKRRVLLKNITVSWGYISEEEQQDKIKKHNLTTEEIKYIAKTRQEIDLTKEKVKQKQ